MGKLHHLVREQRLETTLEEAWAFFSKPANLDAITPRDLKFRIIGEPGPMFPGQIIEYRIKVFGVRQSWVTEIKHVETGVSFVDEQRLGPYKLWYHRHDFEEKGDHVLMRDHVYYALPLGWLGELAHSLLIRRKLAHIFDYRFRYIENLFRDSAKH